MNFTFLEPLRLSECVRWGLLPCHTFTKEAYAGDGFGAGRIAGSWESWCIINSHPLSLTLCMGGSEVLHCFV